MAIDIKKSFKNIYAPKTTPSIIEVPKFNYIAISSKGSPDDEQFQNCVQAIYSVAYTIKMLPKKAPVPENWVDFVVAPLEGDWQGSFEDKQNWEYTLLILQQDFITNDIFNLCKDMALHKKNALSIISEIKFIEIDLQKCVHMLHIGSYGDELNSFETMDKFLLEKSLRRKNKIHREIYLGDPRKVEQEKLKTVLRYEIM